jgi:fructokinase
MNGGLAIVGLGEALWDLLPTGKKLGGATLNVAFHVQQLLSSRGGTGIVASRVGQDSLGNEIVARLADGGMTSEFVQRDAARPTGTVQVELRDGQPHYKFAAGVAWDHLEFTPEWADLARRATGVCFGTLAQRSARSRETIWQFVDAAGSAIRLFDVNLRPPHYDGHVVVESCRRATHVKLNEEELPVVAHFLSLTAGAPVFQLAQLRARYELDAVVYTRGKRGTMLVLADNVISPAAVNYPEAADADPVGAGDACSAAILVGFALGMSPSRIGELANHLGAFVASQPGATPQLPDNILRLLDE